MSSTADHVTSEEFYNGYKCNNIFNRKFLQMIDYVFHACENDATIDHCFWQSIIVPENRKEISWHPQEAKGSLVKSFNQIIMSMKF